MSWVKNWTLRNKIMGLVMFVVLLLTAWSVSEISSNLRQYLIKNLEKHGLEIARDFAVRAPTQININNPYTLQRMINNTMVNSQDVRYIIIFNEKGEVIVHTFENVIPRGLRELNNFVPENGYNIMPVRTNEAVIKDIVVPIRSGTLGFIRVGMTQKNIEAILLTTTIKLILTAIIVLIIAMFAVYFLTRVVTEPILELVEATKAVAEGRFTTARVNTGSWIKEVDQLAMAFNIMSDKLQESKMDAEILEEKRKQLLARLITVQEEERKRISRELHDETGQSLTAMTLELRMMDSAASLQEVRQRAGNIREIINHTFDSLRKLIWELRPSSLDDLEIEAVIKRHIIEGLINVGIYADLQVHNLDGVKLTPEVSTAVFRIVQEAVTNAVKHGQANNISIILGKNENSFLAIVEDNGIGFNVDEAINSALDKKKFGLFGMEERANLVEGQLIIESKMGTGTTVYIKIPVKRGDGGAGKDQSFAC